MPRRLGDGLTRGEAWRGRWKQTTYGFHVPADTPASVEQRILEQSMRTGPGGAVTGWAALRMHGAAYFDGDGRPVPLISTRQLTATPDSTGSRRPLPSGVRQRYGVPCVPVEQALVDEVVDLADDRAAAVAIDMACAARLTSLRRLRAHAERQPRRRREPVLRALAMAREDSVSPAESRMRLIWEVDAGLPRPVCNPLVYGLDGRLLGKPDLLDPDLGVVGEYNGEEHRKRARMRRDVEREDAFRRAGLECFAVVAGDSVHVQVERMLETCRRARATPRPRLWTLDPPTGARRPARLTLDEELDDRDRWGLR